MKIKSINIALTNRCNLKCKYCTIWQELPKKDIPLVFIQRVLSSPIIDNNTHVTCTGGEPFMHPRFSKLIETILKIRQGSLREISTNGTHLSCMLALLKRYASSLPKDFAFHISFDGIHSMKLNRRKEADTILKNIDHLRQAHPKLEIKLKFTITPFNFYDIIPTWKEIKKRRIPIKFKIVECAKNYTNKTKSKTIFSQKIKPKIARDLLAIIDQTSCLDPQRVFLKKSIELILGKLKRRNCQAPFERLFIMPTGLVYSCIHNDPIGHLNNQSLETIWNSTKANNIRSKVLNNGCDKCVAYHGWDS